MQRSPEELLGGLHLPGAGGLSDSLPETQGTAHFLKAYGWFIYRLEDLPPMLLPEACLRHVIL